MKKNRILNRFAFISVFLILCSACYANNSNQDSEPNQIERSSSSSLYSNASQIEQLNGLSSSETSLTENVLFPHIYDEILDWSQKQKDNKGDDRPTALISFCREKAVFFRNYGIYPKFEDFQDNLFLGSQSAYGMELVTYDFLADEWYMSTPYIEQKPRIWENNMIGLVNSKTMENKSDSYILRPVFLNTHCEELPIELDFDYGEPFRASLDYNTFEGGNTPLYERYAMISVTYNSEKDEYIAVYTQNPFWGQTDGFPDASQCELGVAVFDNTGKQLECYPLPQMIYPIDYGRSSLHVAVPQLFVFENNLLIVSQISGYTFFGIDVEDCEQLKGMSILVNLETHEAKRLRGEELQELVSGKLQMEATLNAYNNWEVTKPALTPPFKIVEEGGIQLVYMPDEEQPLYALPAEMIFRAWDENEDGMYHAFFSGY